MIYFLILTLLSNFLLVSSTKCEIQGQIKYCVLDCCEFNCCDLNLKSYIEIYKMNTISYSKPTKSYSIITHNTSHTTKTTATTTTVSSTNTKTTKSTTEKLHLTTETNKNKLTTSTQIIAYPFTTLKNRILNVTNLQTSTDFITTTETITFQNNSNTTNNTSPQFKPYQTLISLTNTKRINFTIIIVIVLTSLIMLIVVISSLVYFLYIKNIRILQPVINEENIELQVLSSSHKIKEHEEIPAIDNKNNFVSIDLN